MSRKEAAEIVVQLAETSDKEALVQKVDRKAKMKVMRDIASFGIIMAILRLMGFIKFDPLTPQSIWWSVLGIVGLVVCWLFCQSSIKKAR
ncbi:MAG: hypothetical protein A3C06_02250 [Candidatus Taylorbacteria bacterium RIFCSPHIGHO2_02_FULL_46_13]|uniref:Uncharacterized protein n=1 Tax=Candidatus Taylorbacteria bacterium RIFCSPHIGHO2_02_FULL_46_13 TaxID=1802312 RepID=A0A1G2MV12_9BACT|nr:MAG: hypothetical protein A3C06_02250 [Candidatus Taylorbacteria bacterium RIFCSPHIGHO2_02_FULL_46_13]